MTEQEYAALIYRLVFHADGNGDICTAGVIKALDTLLPRERLLLENYYRCGKTMKQIGKEIGLSGESVGRIIKKAHRKLRHPSVSRDMSIARAEAYRLQK